VLHETEEKHRHLRDILAILDQSELDEAERALAGTVFRKLAEAEARVHGSSVDRIHFHEVGAVDSIVDVVGVCVGWRQLNVGRTRASAIPTGGGFVEIAHGRCRVPAPATAELLHGVPLAESPCEAELTTPTGAALLACLVDDYGAIPALRISAIGYGAGSQDFPSHPNLLRLIVGEQIGGESAHPVETDEITCLETNIDDTTGELVAHCLARLLEAGALEAFATPILMKKGRPALKISVLCQHSDRVSLEAILFQETNTIGIRRWTTWRSKLPRQGVTVDTAYGEVEGKVVQLPQGVARFSAEFESCRQRAIEHGVSVRDVIEAAELAYARSKTG
jgi:uncharacterized protein (TIGR00299 family) protein